MSCICRWHHRCQHPTNHRHYPMFSKFGCLKKYSFKHKSLSFGQNTLSNHSKLYQCLAFVSVTIDATTHRIIGTTLWFVNLQDWIIICNFQKPLHFVQITLFSHTKLYQCLAFVSVTKDATTPTIICTTLWISSLEVWRNISCFDKFTAFSSLVGFRRQHTQHTHICT